MLLCDKLNKDLSTLAKGGIASRLYSPGGSIGLAIASFGWGFDIQIDPPLGSVIPVSHNVSLDPTRLFAKRHLDPFERCRVHEYDRRRTDRQTDTATGTA